MSDEEPEKDKKSKRTWPHHHARYMLAVFSRYKLNYYVDRKVHPDKIGDGINGWTDEDRALAIGEGRRQLDAQFSQLQYLTSKAGALLPLGVAISLYFITTFDDVGTLLPAWRVVAITLLVAGSTATIWGAALMGSLIGGRATQGLSDVSLLTNESTPLDSYLALDLAELVSKGYDSNAARITHVGTGVTWIVLGTIIGMAGLAVSQWAPTDPSKDSPPICSGYLTEIESILNSNPIADIDAEWVPGGLLGEFADCGKPTEVLNRISD